MLTKIQVTKEDISRGVSCNCRECPIARAILRAMGVTPEENAAVYYPDTHVEVQGRIVMFPRRTGYRATVLPWSAQDFISNYDEDLEVYPFEFELDIPEARAK